MPFTARKVGRGKYQVSRPGHVFAKGTTKAKAQAQVRLLRAVDHGWKPTHEELQSHRERVIAAGMGVLKAALSAPDSVYRDDNVDVSKLKLWLRPGHVLHPPGDESLGEHAFIMLSADRCVEVLGGADDQPHVGNPEDLASVRRMFGDTGWTLYSLKPALESRHQRAQVLVDRLLKS